MADVLSTDEQLGNVKCQGDHVTDVDLQRLIVVGLQGMSRRHVSDSTPGEQQAVMMGTSNQVEVSSNVSTSQAAVNEPLHISDMGKVPEEVTHVDMECTEMTEALLVELLELINMHSLHT